MTRLMNWGFSMYGGYYATVIENEKVIGLHADKLKELKAQLAEYGLKTIADKRRDN